MSQIQRREWHRILQLLAIGNFAAAFDALVSFNDELLQTRTPPPADYDSVISALSLWKAIEEHHAALAH